MLLSKPFVQNENSKREQGGGESERKEREETARKSGSHMIKKGAEVDEERKRHCIEYWIYILYVTDEDQ
jgi:hypothetical protein